MLQAPLEACDISKREAKAPSCLESSRRGGLAEHQVGRAPSRDIRPRTCRWIGKEAPWDCCSVPAVVWGPCPGCWRRSSTAARVTWEVSMCQPKQRWRGWRGEEKPGWLAAVNSIGKKKATWVNTT